MLRVLSRLLLVTGVFLAGCSKSRPKDAHDREKLVPESTQEEAERTMGQQQLMMEELNMTPAERAAAQHQRAMDRRPPPDEDK